jgi:hypothetical protein
MILSYLEVAGFAAAAREFAQESHQTLSTSVSVLDRRMEIRRSIQEGNIDQAETIIQQLTPNLFNTDRRLHFELEKAKFIECTLRSDGAEALRLAQHRLFPFAVENPKFLEEFEQIFVLLAFPDLKAPNLPSLIQDMISPREKIHLAERVNERILKELGIQGEKESQIVEKIKQFAWTQNELAKWIDFPKIEVGGESGNSQINGGADVNWLAAVDEFRRRMETERKLAREQNSGNLSSPSPSPSPGS